MIAQKSFIIIVIDVCLIGESIADMFPNCVGLPKCCGLLRRDAFLDLTS